LGKGGRELVETLNVPVQKYLSVVRTIFWERPATHKIDLTERAKVFKDRPYPMSPANRRILALGAIEGSKSPLSNRTTVKSRHGKDRFSLNAIDGYDH